MRREKATAPGVGSLGSLSLSFPFPFRKNFPRLEKKRATAHLTEDKDSVATHGKRRSKTNEKAIGGRDHWRAGKRGSGCWGSQLALEKDQAWMIKPEDLQRIACSRMEASTTSVRTITTARTVQGFLRTRGEPVLGGGSVGRRRKHLLKASKWWLWKQSSEQVLGSDWCLPRGQREMFCLSTVKCASGTSLSAAFILHARASGTGVSSWLSPQGTFI